MAGRDLVAAGQSGGKDLVVHGGVPEETPLRRELPYNLEAEKCLLGAILMNNRAIDHVSDFLRGDHFAFAANQVIYDACLKAIENGNKADPITLRSVAKDPAVAEVGGAQYLVHLLDSTVTVINAPEYARLIQDCWMRRRLIAIAQARLDEAYSGTLPADQIIDGQARDLDSLQESGLEPDQAPATSEQVHNTLKALESAYKGEGVRAYRTRFDEVDAKLVGSGFQPGQAILLGGRPSMGKSALAVGLVENVAESSGLPVAFFSFEMTYRQVHNRRLSRRTMIEYKRLVEGRVSSEEFEQVALMGHRLTESRVWVDDTPSLRVSQIRRRAARFKRRQGGLGMVVVDHLGITAPDSARDHPVQQLKQITRDLKNMAKELDCPVLLLHQLNRSVDTRDDKRPTLIDLRDSGAIEENADIVLFVFREEYYLERQTPMRREGETDEALGARQVAHSSALSKVMGRAEVIIAKQRDGETGRATLQFHGPTMTFKNWDEQGTFDL